jgi:2-oxoglutarate ferredoxin oxidoreductase subunit gamma
VEPKIDARQVELPMYDAVMDQIGKPIVFNICMLGVFIKLTGIVKEKSVLKVLKTKIPPDFIRMNQRALEIGLRLAENSQHIS